MNRWEDMARTGVTSEPAGCSGPLTSSSLYLLLSLFLRGAYATPQPETPPSPPPEEFPAAASAAEPADGAELTANTEKMYRAEIDRLLDIEQELTLDLEECELEASGAETLRRRLANLEAENQELRENLTRYQQGLEEAVDQLKIHARAPGRQASAPRRSSPPPPRAESAPFVAIRQPWAEIDNGVAAIEGTIHNTDSSRRAEGVVILTLESSTR